MEIRERGMRPVLEHAVEYASQWAAIATKCGHDAGDATQVG